MSELLLYAGIEAELDYLRAEAESRMRDTVEVRRPVGFTYDGDTEVVDYELVFTSKCRVSIARSGLAPAVSEGSVGARNVATNIRTLQLPVTAPPARPDDVGVIVALGPLSDHTLLGARLRITGPAPGSQVTTRRLEVKELLS